MIERGLLAARWFLGMSLVAYSFYALFAVWAARLWKRARRPIDPAWTPPVTLLKPVRGVDADMAENFRSYCRQNYPPGNVQILFGALEADDAALEFVRALQVEFPHIDIRAIVHPATPLEGFNLKLCNLSAMLPHAAHSLLVLNDSDIRVTPDYLRRVVAPFAGNSRLDATSEQTAAKASPGCVTCAYYGVGTRDFAGRLEALGMGADFIPSTMVSRALEGVTFGLGQTIVMPRQVLDEMGGFEPIADELADDYRLVNNACRLGYRAELSDYLVQNVLGPEPFRVMWARRLRWARTNRFLRPWGYAGSYVTHGFALSLLFLLASRFSPLGWTVCLGVLSLRLITALAVAAQTGDPNVRRLLPLLPLSDALSFVLFLLSFCGSRIVWRGVRFRVLPGCRLFRLDPSPSLPQHSQEAASLH